MNCEKVKEEILATNGDYTPELKKHLEECKPCQQLAKQWQAVKDIQPDDLPEVPLSADFRVRREAEMFIRNRQIQSKTFTRWLALCATAACVMLVSWLALSLLKETSIGNNKKPQLPIELADNGYTNSKVIAWEDIDLDDELYDLDVEIEFNDATFRVSDEYQSETNGSNGDFNVEIPDLIT